MRLCYIKLNYFPPYAGGGSRMAYTLFKYLAQEHEVHVVTNTSPGYTQSEQTLNGVHVHRIPISKDSYSPSQGLKFFLYAGKMIKKLHAKHQFNVVHGFSAFSIMGLFISWLRIKNTKLCFTYEAFPLGLRDLVHMHKLYHFSGMVPHFLWSNDLHRIYVVSQYSMDALKRRRVNNKSRVVILPPAIDIDNYQQNHSRKEWSNDFVYASACTVWKGIGDIIEAMSLIKKERSDFRVIMFSPPVSKTWTPDARFDKMIHDYGLENNHVLIHQFRSDIGTVMARSRAVIAPFRSMLGTLDIPLSLLEGMAVKVPVIGSTIGGIPEIVKDGENGLLVSPQKPQQLANAMLKLLRDDDLCSRMGAYGGERVKDFSVDRIGARLIEDYAHE